MASRQERKLTGSGTRLIAIGAPFVVIGLVLALLLNGNTLGIGAAIAVLGAIPVVVGIVLLLTAGTNRHARKDRPFA
jgi:multidrug efflux pump subunit AcrB